MIGMLVSRLDGDTNGQVTMEELSRFFERADREKTSFINAEDILEALKDEEPLVPEQHPSDSQLLSMFFSGQLGWFEEGPKLGDLAPDFTLEKHDQSGKITLSDFQEKKPVVLIFGSFT
jgi:hypothetical protein